MKILGRQVSYRMDRGRLLGIGRATWLGVARMASKRLITVKMWRGLVDDVKGLPNGWQYAVEDWDAIEMGDDTRKRATPKTVIIVVRRGLADDVRNLPRGYRWKERDTSAYEDGY